MVDKNWYVCLLPSFFRGSFDGTPLPWGKLFPVMLLIGCESFNGSSIFAYVAFMVRDFGLVGLDNTESAGYYVGFIASVYYVAQFISSFFWGRMSDRFGRRPILLFGAIGQLLSSLAFGFSTNLPWAIVGRSLNGLLNGNIGVVKTYVGEVTDSTNQARAFGLISLFGGAGGILGAAIGGFTARLAVKFPELFSDTVWETFPYLMPNLIATSVTLIGLLLAYFLVTEPTHDQMVGLHSLKHDAEEDEQGLGSPQVEGDADPSSELLSSDDVSSSSSLTMVTSSMDRSSIWDRIRSIFSQNGNGTPHQKYSQLSQSSRNLRAVHKSLQRETSTTQKSAREPFTAIFFERNAVIACCLYALLGFEHTVYDEVMPLLISNPIEKGGLGFNTTRIGAIGAAAGFTTIIIQLFIFPIVAKKWGMIACFRYGSLISFGPFFLLPYLNVLVNQLGLPVIVAWPPLLILVIVKSLSSNIAFSAVMSLIVNSVYYHQMGSANGLGQSLVALTRAVAPIVGGPVLAWSSHNGLPFPVDRSFMFNVLALLCLVNALATAPLPLSMNKPRAEVEGDNPVEPTSLTLHEDEPTHNLDVEGGDEETDLLHSNSLEEDVWTRKKKIRESGEEEDEGMRGTFASSFTTTSLAVNSEGEPLRDGHDVDVL